LLHSLIGYRASNDSDDHHCDGHVAVRLGDTPGCARRCYSRADSEVTLPVVPLGKTSGWPLLGDAEGLSAVAVTPVSLSLSELLA
jgi:hypothetical protein